MKLPIVYRVLSLISLIVAFFMFFPLAWAWHDGTDDFMAFVGAIAIGVIVSYFLFMMSFGQSDYKDLGIKEAFAVVGFSWVIASAVGALPYILSGILPNYTDAFFETMSGFTTTGSSVITDVEACPRGILFWRDLTHWLGGMGIIVLGLAILPFFGVGGMELYKAEVPGPTPEKLTPRVQQTAMLLWGVYVLITIVETLLLMLGGMDFFSAVTHSFGTVATGGFSTKNTSVAWFNSAYIDWVITFFMFISGVNFALHYKFLTGNFKGYARDDEFLFYTKVVLICSALTSFMLYFGGWYQSIADSFRYGAFQVVSIMTTTGFCTADYEQWPFVLQFMLLLIMFLGGCAGSTGGGIKNMRILLLWRRIRTETERVLHPNAIIHTRVNNVVITREAVSSVAVFVMIFVLLFIFASLLITALNIDLITAMSSVAATLCNIGPGLGKVGPVENFQWMPDAAKWILSFCMLAGRLELYAVLMLVVPATWKS